MVTIVAERRAGRSFTDEFKSGAVRLVLDQGKTIAQVARDLELDGICVYAMGGAGASRPDEGQDRADHRGARGAREAAQGSPRAENGARHPKKCAALFARQSG